MADKLVEILELGDLTTNTLFDRFAEKYGLKPFDANEVNYMRTLYNISIDPMSTLSQKQTAMRTLRSIINAAKQGSVKSFIDVVKNWSFVALLSGYNTAISSFVASVSGNFAEEGIMTGQLVARGKYGIYRKYKAENRDLFSVNPIAFMQSIFTGDANNYRNSAGYSATLDALRFGISNIATSDIPEGAFTSLDNIVNEYIDRLITSFGGQSKLEYRRDRTAKDNLS